MPLRFTVLGAVQALGAQRAVRPWSGRVRALLAALVVEAGTTVHTGALIRGIWDGPPASAYENLRTHVMTLRRELEAAQPGLGAVVVTDRTRGGYTLAVPPRECDVHLFDEAANEGYARWRADDPAGARTALRRALALWRGPAGDDLPAVGRWLHARLVAVEERRQGVIEALAEADIALGDHRAATDRLTRLTAANPLRERAWALLLRARYLDGDVAGALAAFDLARASLADELGIDPGGELVGLRLAVLRRQDAVVAAPDQSRVSLR
jgi:SARP family transcriptional regulator, regulator of embCAB operon